MLSMSNYYHCYTFKHLPILGALQITFFSSFSVRALDTNDTFFAMLYFISLSHVSSNINMASEICTFMNLPEILWDVEWNKKTKKPKGSWFYVGRNAARSCC